jgi:hypothetical protein
MLRRSFVAVLCCWSALSSLTAEPEGSPKPVKEELPENVDRERFLRAPVVLRAKLIKPLGGESGMSWYRMEVIATLRNTVRQKFGPTQDVFTAQQPKFGGVPDPGPPAAECTIYIEPIRHVEDGKEKFHWRLLEGKSEVGVSHVAKV